jgi:hypothetical protein
VSAVEELMLTTIMIHELMVYNPFMKATPERGSGISRFEEQTHIETAFDRIQESCSPLLKSWRAYKQIVTRYD